MREFICVSILSTVAFGQAPKRTTLDGVYSNAQAGRGAELFAAKCARCHEGADVDGPPLTQDPFLDRWREDSLQPLYTFLKTKMPQDAPGSLTEANYVELLGAILAKNAFPTAGPAGKDLTVDSLPSILLVGHDGPKQIPSNVAVIAVGCFDGASLNNVGDLGRTQNPDETSPEEMKSSASKPMGAKSYRLTGDLKTDAKGHKVQVKGVLQRPAAGERINALSLEVVAPACP